MSPETRSLLHRSATLHRATVSLLEILAKQDPKRRTGELAGEIRAVVAEIEAELAHPEMEGTD